MTELDNWQGNLKTYGWIPEKKIFLAHKLIFAISSPEFENIFYLMETDMNEIVLADTRPETFKEFLHYIYTFYVEEITILATKYMITLY